MNKIILAIFCAALMLVLPATSSAFSTDIEKITSINEMDDEIPIISITESQKQQLDLFVNTIGDSEAKQQASNLINTIVEPEEDYYNIDMTALSDALSLIGFRPIPEDKLNLDNILLISQEDLDNLLETYWGVNNGEIQDNPIRELIQKIIDMIKDRLGWVYRGFTDALNLFVDGVTLILEFVKEQVNAAVAVTASFVLVINQLLSAPEKIKELIGLLFDKEFQDFMNTVIEFKDDFVTSCKDVVDGIRLFVTNFANLNAYLDQVYDFLNWIDDDPWTQNISISGRVTTLFGGALSGALVTCRGETITTNSNGEFSFSVPSNPDDDSFPANQWYGMHNCQIKVTYNGEILKDTSKWLSYSFSGGKIQWNSLIVKSRSRNIKEVFSSILDNILLKIRYFFSFYSKTNYQ